MSRKASAMDLNIGGGANELYSNDIENQLGSIFDSSNYKRAIEEPAQAPLEGGSLLQIDRNFDSNLAYWSAVLERNIFNGAQVKLSGFHILEWLPQFPGLVHTGHSQVLIRDAIKYGKKRTVDDRFIEFEPDGKALFLKAGYGSMRFGTKMVRGQEYYLLAASSSGKSHEGIPLILSERVYQEVIREMKHSFGVFADVVGRVKLLPNKENPILHWRNIPSYYLFVEEINIRKLSAEGDNLRILISLFRKVKMIVKTISGRLNSFTPTPGMKIFCHQLRG